MLLTRCLSPEEAYRQVERKAPILIGALLSLGAAVETSGAGKYRFYDFFKVGRPLTVLIYILAIVLVPWVWPLQVR